MFDVLQSSLQICHRSLKNLFQNASSKNSMSHLRKTENTGWFSKSGINFGEVDLFGICLQCCKDNHVCKAWQLVHYSTRNDNRNRLISYQCTRLQLTIQKLWCEERVVDIQHSDTFAINDAEVSHWHVGICTSFTRCSDLKITSLISLSCILRIWNYIFTVLVFWHRMNAHFNKPFGSLFSQTKPNLMLKKHFIIDFAFDTQLQIDASVK